MTQLIIQLENTEKAKMLSEFLSALTFVHSIEIAEEKESNDSTENFFAMAGLWENQDISIDSIRQKAWPNQNI